MSIDNETINLLFKAIISLISIVITGFLVPWLKNKIGEQKWAKIIKCTELAVRTAEQIFSSDEYAEKKEYAVKKVCEEAQKVGINLTEDEVVEFVESQVNYVKYGTTYTRQ